MQRHSGAASRVLYHSEAELLKPLVDVRCGRTSKSSSGKPDNGILWNKSREVDLRETTKKKKTFPGGLDPDVRPILFSHHANVPTRSSTFLSSVFCFHPLSAHTSILFFILFSILFSSVLCVILFLHIIFLNPLFLSSFFSLGICFSFPHPQFSQIFDLPLLFLRFSSSLSKSISFFSFLSSNSSQSSSSLVPFTVLMLFSEILAVNNCHLINCHSIDLP